MRLKYYVVTVCCMISFCNCKTDNSSHTNAATADSLKLENTIPAANIKSTTVDINTLSGEYKIDEGSMISWTGTAPMKNHVGTLTISAGSFTITDGKIMAGNFTVDMNSITNTDLPADKGQDLISHLKSDEFFETTKYPTATFTLTSSEKIQGNDKITHKIKGDLKIKDQSQPITFDAYVIGSDSGKVITATTPNFDIDRTKYGIKYRSGLLNTAKDKIINDKVGIIINIRAKKQ